MPRPGGGLSVPPPRSPSFRLGGTTRSYARQRDGRVDAVTTDNIILLGFINADPTNLKLVNKPFTTEPYGIGVKKGDTVFRAFVNDTLEKAYADGSWKKAWDATAGKTGQAAPTPPPVNRYA